jgi:hypothetical protein
MRRRIRLHSTPFLSSTFHLSAEETGAFALLLFHWFEHGALPAAEKMHEVARVPKSTWPQCKDEILRLFEKRQGWSAAENIVGIGLRQSRPAIPTDVRRRVRSRDGTVCAYCGASDRPIHLDHRIPRSRGGLDTYENLVVSCVTCNTSKGALTDEEFIRWRA